MLGRKVTVPIVVFRGAALPEGRALRCPSQGFLVIVSPKVRLGAFFVEISKPA